MLMKYLRGEDIEDLLRPRREDIKAKLAQKAAAQKRPKLSDYNREHNATRNATHNATHNNVRVAEKKRATNTNPCSVCKEAKTYEHFAHSDWENAKTRKLTCKACTPKGTRKSARNRLD